MGIESVHQQKDPRIAIQAPLLLVAAGLDIHEDDSIKRRQAAHDWIASGNAELFRNYIDAHPEQVIDADDDAAVVALWEQITHTLH
jgi:hypothetical protein